MKKYYMHESTNRYYCRSGDMTTVVNVNACQVTVGHQHTFRVGSLMKEISEVEFTKVHDIVMGRNPLDFIIDPSDKFYPAANTWMWTYCTFLGKFTNSVGDKFDLGIALHVICGPSEATVYGNEPGDYYSGSFRIREDTSHITNPTHLVYLERERECLRRAKLLNLI